MEVRFYLLCNRYEALVASHLDPESFGAYMAVGNLRQTTGEEIFIEIDPNKVGDAIDMEKARESCKPHKAGNPRRSKYISVYRALERLPVESMMNLHLVTRDGLTLPLEGEMFGTEEQNGPHMYMELSPAGALVVSSLAPGGFVKFITNMDNAVSYPKVFLVDMLIDTDDEGKLASFLPYSHPDHISECLRIVTEGKKITKTVDRRPNISSFYRTIRRGFYVGNGDALKFYPYPSKAKLDEDHHRWWRSASLG